MTDVRLERTCSSIMKSILRISGLVGAISFVLFFAVQFYAGCCGEVPTSAQWYATSFESLLMSFLGSYWFLGLFLCAWFGILAKLSSNSGWKTLSEKYGIKRLTGDRLQFRAVSGYVGEVRCDGSLKIAVTTQGLYLKVLFLFKFGHKDLFIPWSDITISVEKRGLPPAKAPLFLSRLVGRLLRSNYLRVHLRQFPDQKLILEVPDSLLTHIPSEIMESTAKQLS
ncbi:MAG: hypothetical protein CMI04_04030 [Oceanospirillaceae bacterium]|nr:hypothetical protein [Oceanospirillaceae bacterium]